MPHPCHRGSPWMVITNGPLRLGRPAHTSSQSATACSAVTSGAHDLNVPDTAPDAHHLKNARQHDAFQRLREISVRVLVLAVVERLVGLRLRRPVAQEAEVGSDERVW